MLALSPLWVPVAVFLGALFAAPMGWGINYLEAKRADKTARPDSFDFMKLIASAIIGVPIAVMALATYASAVSVGLPDLVTVFGTGLTLERVGKKLIGI